MVDKLKIKSFLDDHFKKPSTTFIAQINPSSYSEAYQVEYDEDFGIDSAGSTPYLVGIRPRVLVLDMVFDATGAIPGPNASVRKRLDDFKGVVYTFENDIHSPKLLWILWGSLSFKCVLEGYDIDHTLFDPTGLPLRAKLKATFKGYDATDTIELQAGKQSADLTHRRLVLAGDTLPLLCAEIYGDGAYYLQIARHNGLVGFRALEPGVELQFPPLRVLETMESRA